MRPSYIMLSKVRSYFYPFIIDRENLNGKWHKDGLKMNQAFVLNVGIDRSYARVMLLFLVVMPITTLAPDRRSSVPQVGYRGSPSSVSGSND